jgi:transcriptional regulator GlxA family with amidase domain
MHMLKLFMALAIVGGATACGGGAASAAASGEAPEAKLPLTKSGIMKVAFVVSDQATLIDIVGPMQTFDQVQTPGNTGFQTFTVSETRQPIKSGNLTITPDYTFADVPDADIVVVGAQTGKSEPYLNYIRAMAAKGKLMLSVCTGVSKFAQAGILDGLQATSHHGFAKTYPKVKWVKDRAYVHSAPNIYTAGGEMSGVELALHITELYFDHDVAVKTARYMEYRGPAWQM